ncbi:uncharacterized protein V6R79_021480 [Siganus canaliculatus]
MEPRKSTTAGVLFWTPAPVRTSPTSSEISEDVWEDEDEEQAEEDDDFAKQMDENGIIGLTEALQAAEFGETCDADTLLDPNLLSGSFEADLSEREKIPAEGLRSSLSCAASPGEDEPSLSQSVDDEVWQRNNIQDLPDSEPAVLSGPHCPRFQPTSPEAANPLPHLRHFTAEEIAAAPGIEAETFPDMSFLESLPESQSGHKSLRSSPRCPETELFSEEVQSHHHRRLSTGPGKGPDRTDKHHKGPSPSPRRTQQLSPEAVCSARSLKFKHQTKSSHTAPRNNAVAVDESSFRSRALSHSTPDFSKVEPRVHFPKGGYKPPKSKHLSKQESLSPEIPLVFKSPADIVKEVLLNIPDGSPDHSDPDRPASSAPDFTVPSEFRCRQHATTLLEQLQEDYNTLLTKYAEAENTIDRLRLEAKVKLYSDPPKPGHMVQSGLKQEPSRCLTLDFPQAQRAEFSSASPHPAGHTSPHRSSSTTPGIRSPDPQVGQQLTRILSSQTDKFLQQLQTFESLLNCKKLKRSEQMQGLCQLADGLDSLEKGYLLMRDEQKLLLQGGTEATHFDPERELEQLIFQCGLRVDELKEQVEKTLTPSRSLRSTPSPAPSVRGNTPTRTQSQPVFLLDPVEPVPAAASSAREDSGQETDSEETLNALNLQPPHVEHRRVEHDFEALSDDQRFKERPQLFSYHPTDAVAVPTAAGRTDVLPEEKTIKTQSSGTGIPEVPKSPPKRKSGSQDAALCTSRQRSSRSSPPSHRTPSQSVTPPVDRPGSSRSLGVRKSHSSSLNSLGELAALDRSNSKLQTKSSRVLSQDGLISPETDSGFIGSESSRLTPAAASSPVHQRASESVSAAEQLKRGKPQTGPVSAVSPSHSPTAVEPSGGSETRALSCSPRRWVRHTQRRRTDSGTSGFGLDSDSSGHQQNDRYTESICSSRSCSSSSASAARHHHGDSLLALSSQQASNRNDAIQSLQSEVTRLKEKLESSLRRNRSLTSVGAASSTLESLPHHSTSTPRIRSAQRRSDVRRGRRDKHTGDDVEELRQPAQKRPPPAHGAKLQPDLLMASEPPAVPPQVSRWTQTSAAAPDSSRTHPRQHHVQEATDEPDHRSRPTSHCSLCLSHRQGQPQGPAGGTREPTPSCCHHCPLCGCTEVYRSPEPGWHRGSDSPSHSASRQPAPPPDATTRSRHCTATAPPALLHCVQMCPPQLLLYSSPLGTSDGNIAGASSEVRGRRVERERPRRSLSVDKQRSMDSSLSRAIRAARHMKHTSGHMARSLAAGLQYQELLTQSCSH